MPDSPLPARPVAAAPARAATVLAAVSIFAALGACAGHTGAVSRGQQLDDFVINTRVKAAVFADPALKETVIDVSTRDGRVRLAGSVASAGDAARAADVVRRVPGVKSLSNELAPRTP